MDLDQRLAKAWESGHISVGTLWSYYCAYPYLTRMKNREVLANAIEQIAVNREQFLAEQRRTARA